MHSSPWPSPRPDPGPEPSRTVPLRVAVLTTDRAPGLGELLAHPARARDWTLVQVVATDPASQALELAGRNGVAARVHDLAAFARARGALPGDLEARIDFDRATRKLLEPGRPDLVVLCGYLHIVTEPLLEAYPDRVVNLHDSDLLIPGSDGLPRYRGLRSTRDAVFAGERETRSTAHLVAAEVDAGPPIVRSWGFPTHPMVDDARRWGGTDILKAYAYAQREWMMRASWGALLSETMELFARNRVRRLGGRMVVDGRLGPRDLEPPVPGVGAPVPGGEEAIPEVEGRLPEVEGRLPDAEGPLPSPALLGGEA